MTDHSPALRPLAALCVAFAIVAATPVAAVEAGAAVKSPVVTAPNKPPSAIGHHAARHSRLGISRHTHRFSLTGSGSECAGAWCGRQFVLMVGIGF